jgi:hypothetical protein
MERAAHSFHKYVHQRSRSFDYYTSCHVFECTNVSPCLIFRCRVIKTFTAVFSQSHTNRPVVAGVSVAAVVLLLLSIIVPLFICRHKPRRNAVERRYTSFSEGSDVVPAAGLQAPGRVHRKPVPEVTVVPHLMTLSMMTGSPSVDPFQAYKPERSRAYHDGPLLSTYGVHTDPFSDPPNQGQRPGRLSTWSETAKTYDLASSATQVCWISIIGTCIYRMSCLVRLV